MPLDNKMSREEYEDRQRMIAGFKEYNRLAESLGSNSRFVLIGHPQLDPELAEARRREKQAEKEKKHAQSKRLKALRRRKKDEAENGGW
jgi:hypothetical protein